MARWRHRPSQALLCPSTRGSALKVMFPGGVGGHRIGWKASWCGPTTHRLIVQAKTRAQGDTDAGAFS